MSAALKAAAVQTGDWLGFGDEMRLGLLGQVRRVWGVRGIRVVQPVQQVREWQYLALVVNAQQGQIHWTWVPNMKKESIAAGVQRWKEAGVVGVVWDRAGSHRSGLVRAVGLKLIEQPAYAPELNPAERVIEELRRAVEGRRYESLEAKTTAVEEALKKLTAAPAAVKRLVNWAWVQEATDQLAENTAVP